jgi:conjugal transfer mating pair stabilization protein TraG
MSSAAFATGGQASTTADGNWSFNNMSMDNVNANKFDTNMVHRSGSQAFQTTNGSMHTQTADGSQVYDTSGAISNLPVNMRLSALASSGYSEQARQAQQEAQSSLDGYNHSVTSGFQQMNQLTRQSGNSDTMTQGSDSSVATNVSRGASKMQSAVESYAKSHNISEQQAYNQLMDITNRGSMGADGKAYVKFDSGDQLAGKLGKWATGLSVGGEASVNTGWQHTSGSAHGTQDTNSESRDNRHDQNSQEARDFREGMDMVTSTRLSQSGSHTDNQSNSQAQQFAATLNDAKSQYHQYTESSTRSQEFSRMATLSQSQSASLDANYNQEFVNWTTAKYGSDAQNILTNVKSAQTAATEFMHERLEPEIMRNYGARTEQVNSEPLQPSRTLENPVQSSQEGLWPVAIHRTHKRQWSGMRHPVKQGAQSAADVSALQVRVSLRVLLRLSRQVVRRPAMTPVMTDRVRFAHPEDGRRNRECRAGSLKGLAQVHCTGLSRVIACWKNGVHHTGPP